MMAAPEMSDAEAETFWRFEMAASAPEAYWRAPILLQIMDRLDLTRHVERLVGWISRLLSYPGEQDR